MVKTEKIKADDLRARMKEMEISRDYDKIIELRQKVVNKLKSKETK